MIMRPCLFREHPLKIDWHESLPTLLKIFKLVCSFWWQLICWKLCSSWGIGVEIKPISSWGMAVDPPERDERERRSREERGTAAGPGRSEYFLSRNCLPCWLIYPGGSSWCRSGWASSSTDTASFVPARLPPPANFLRSVRKDIGACKIFGYCLTDNLRIPPE